MSSAQAGSYGRIPPETVALFERTVRAVKDEVVAGLPPQASSAVRADTVEMVLEVVLRDWRENNNTTGLLASDVTDLRNFVALAASLAGSDINGQGRPIYAAVLRGLLGDWLANWNAPGDAGPPGPID